MTRWKVTVVEDAAGDGPGEDRWMFHEESDGSAWAAVIDGASSHADECPTGGEYADALRAALLETLSNHGEQTPSDALARAIGITARNLELPRPSAPSAAVALARWTDSGVSAAILGDVSVVLLSSSKEEAASDDRLGDVGRQERHLYKEALRAGGGYGASHRATMKRLRDIETSARNRQGGYWIAAEDPEASAHAVTLEAEAPAMGLLLASDGAASGVTRYGLWSNWRGLARSLEENPRAMIDRLRSIENQDARGQRWPRSKPHDDLVALLIRPLH
jgi:hypothetical protein